MAILKHEGSILKVDILVEGSSIADSVEILSINTSTIINKVPSATISLAYGGLQEGDFAAKPSQFAPGKKVEIKSGYDNSSKTIFKGIVTKISHRYATDFFLIIEMRGESVKLITQRKYGVFQKKKDSDIISELGQKAGLTISCDTSSVTHEEIVQYGCSDWDFILLRAEYSGMLLLDDGDKIKIFKPKFSGNAALDIEGYNGVYSMNIEIDSTYQFKKAETLSWIPKDLKSLKSSVSSSEEMSIGAFSNSKLSSVINSDPLSIYSPMNIAKDGLDSLAKGKLMRVALDKVKGEIEIIGISSVLCGDLIKLKNFDAFDGTLFVSGIEHSIEDGSWKTTLIIGMPFGSYAEETPMIDLPSLAGTGAAFKGLATGMVKKIHEDSEGQYRVEVSLPMLGSDTENLHVHARLANLYATNGAGSFFYPEIGDEVILGFMHEDPSQPVILGMLYSSKNKPKFEPDAKNQFKGFVTKEQLIIQMDDVDKIITISTPGENVFTLDDKEGQITLTDKNKNTITMSKDGITIESAKDIILKAKSNIKMEATSNIEMKATADLKGAGMNVNLEAQTGLVAKGSATAELSASGQTTVKGAIVMIN